jgi:hypothetical protein
VAEDTNIIANTATSNSGVIRRTKEFYLVIRVLRLSHCPRKSTYLRDAELLLRLRVPPGAA